MAQLKSFFYTAKPFASLALILLQRLGQLEHHKEKSTRIFLTWAKQCSCPSFALAHSWNVSPEVFQVNSGLRQTQCIEGYSVRGVSLTNAYATEKEAFIRLVLSAGGRCWATTGPGGTAFSPEMPKRWSLGQKPCSINRWWKKNETATTNLFVRRHRRYQIMLNVLHFKEINRSLIGHLVPP